MNTSATASVGLIELPELAALCTQLGLSPVTGGDYRTAATSIRAALDSLGPFPIFVSDAPFPGMRAWMERAARETTVVVLHGALGNGTQFSGVASVNLPASIGDIFAAAGYAAPANVTDLIVDVNGVVGASAPLAAVPDPVAEVAAPAPVAEPVTAPPAPVVEAPVEDEDPWEAQRQTPAYAPEPVAPVVEAPVYTEPVVVAPPAPVIEAPAEDEDPWEAQRADRPVVVQAPVHAPEPVVEAAPPAPVAPVIEAPAYDEQPTYTPAPAVEQPIYPAPVAETAPPAPVAPVIEPPAPTYDEQPAAAPVHIDPQPEAPVYAPEPVVEAAPPAPTYAEPVHAPEPEAPAYVHVPEPVVEAAPPAPTYAEPVFEQPVFESPTAHAPVIQPPTPEVPAYDNVVALAPPRRVAPSVPAIRTGAGIVPAPPQQGLAETVVVWAGKGGVAKSTTSFSLAQRAAKAGLRVILVDGNMGQGDMRSFLRVGDAGLPSMYQAAISGDLRQALIDPDMLNAARSPKLDPLGFALVQAPPRHLAKTDIVTPEAYLTVVEQARRICDLVVVDTQIVESMDDMPMRDRFVIPMLRAGAWGVGLSELSPPSIANLLAGLRDYAVEGVSRERQMTAMTRVPREVPYNVEGIGSALNEHSVFLGTIWADPAVHQAMSQGRAVSHMPVIAPILDAALNRITGLSEFSPNAAAAAAAQADFASAEAGSSRGGFLSRLRKSRA